MAAPGFVDGSLGGLRLQASSATVNSGTAMAYDRDLEGNLTPVDSNGGGMTAEDAGAYELG